MSKATRKYVLFDSRACGGQGTDNVSVLDVCDTNEEAKEQRGHFGGMACYSYAIDGSTLRDERHEWDYFPAGDG